ncbi:hypothetical protein GE09DRAFT_1145327 [Coniochaeta sp. 2T2.1]|nr:hypothetical protein GE09DRAFT_1145327 [Coniochaeta sp. 2T2.1]
MEALFDAPSNSHGCMSLDDLQHQLRQLLDSKVTPTKAEHVSVTFELRNVTFSVPVTEAENASLEAGGGVDPRLFGGGARARSTVTGVDGQLIRQINALDTVLNQSQDDPVAQRTVAKHIVAGVGEADQAQWIMRSMTRGYQGWTFTYGCKDSAQTWARQNAKTPPKTVVGEWSSKDGQDQVNLSRPAFDCRGTLTIVFSKSEKAISVKYDHTNMHKTVAELLDLLAPPPPRPQPVASSTKKTPKKKQTAEGGENGVDTPDGATPRPKKRKKPTQDGDQPSTQKKRQRKKKSADDAQIDPTLSMTLPDAPGARPVGDSAQRSLYNTQAQGGAANGGAYPQGLVGNEPFNGSEAQASALVSSEVHQNSILNLPAGEAERRREVAIRLLTVAKVDPQTLSPEQFSIFANQSPALQEESLKMLVEFGAERLRIVLPDKGAQAASSQDQPAQQSPAQDAQPPANAGEAAKRKRKASRKKAEADGTGEATETSALTHTETVANRQKKPKGARLSRGSCIQCKASKAKCGKEKPSCSNCLETGTACSYPLQQSRKSKAAEEEAESAEEAGEPEQPPDTPEAVQNQEEEPDDLPSPGFVYQDPGAPPHQDLLNQDPEVEEEPQAGPMPDNPQQTYGDHSNGVYRHSGGPTFPDTLSPEATQQTWASGTGMDYSQHSQTNHNLNFRQQTSEPSHTLSFPNLRSTANTSTSHSGSHQSQKSWGSYTASQAAGVVDVPTTTSSVSANIGHTTTSWSAYPTQETTNAKQASASPRQSRRTAKPSNTASYSSSVSDHVSALAQAAMQTAAARTASPVQNPQYEPAVIAGAKSRQGMKPQGQTRTLVPSQPSRQAQRPTPAAAANTGYSTASDKNTAPNYNNHSQYSTSTTNQSNNEVAYQPYSQQNTAATTATSYPSYDNNSTRSYTSNTLPLNNTSLQQVASSYTPTPSTTANQWTDTSTTQARNPLAYSNTSSASSSSVNMRASNPQRSHLPATFNNIRPQAPNPPSRPSSTTAYNQTQHSLPQQNTYSSYPSNPQASSTQQQQQQGWYTGPSTAANYNTAAARGNTTNAGYSSSGTASNSNPSHNASSYGQQGSHHAMNLSGNTYSAGEGGMYNLLPGGSGH